MIKTYDTDSIINFWILFENISLFNFQVIVEMDNYNLNLSKTYSRFEVKGVYSVWCHIDAAGLCNAICYQMPFGLSQI